MAPLWRADRKAGAQQAPVEATRLSPKGKRSDESCWGIILEADPRSWQWFLSLPFGPQRAPDSPFRKRQSCLDQKIISWALSEGFKYTFNLH